MRPYQQDRNEPVCKYGCCYVKRKFQRHYAPQDRDERVRAKRRYRAQLKQWLRRVVLGAEE